MRHPNREEPKIIQIIPAVDWYQVCEQDGEMIADPLVCFALLDNGSIDPMWMGSDGLTSEATEFSNFEKISHKSQMTKKELESVQSSLQDQND